VNAPAAAPESTFPIVGIGASAGGLEAFMQLLQALPEHTGMAFVLVQHLDPKHDSRLADLLAKATRMPVREATHGLAPEPDHVYVIAPGTALALAADGALQVEPRGEAQGGGPHLPIDQFFKSLAARRAGAAIGVVLSGTGTDGTLGLEEIKAAGGITFAQDEASAKFAGMPLAALHSGCVDLVLPPERIAAELARIGRHPYLAPAAAGEAQGPAGAAATSDGDEQRFQAVLGLLRIANGVDFSAYRDTTIRRRIQRRMLLQGGEQLAGYVERLKGDRAELDALYHDILINVTRFFREPEVFEALKERVFPDILAARHGDEPIRLWVPGCSTGQEAYSLAIVLLEFLDAVSGTGPAAAIQIFATDLSDSVALQRARAGVYPESIEAEVSPERLRRFFHKEDSSYRIAKSLREIVVFARQNVAADPPFSRLHLISCRNLLIYLSPVLQKRVIPTFHYALNAGGYLLLGASESIGSHTELFSVVDQSHRIYQRKSSGAMRPYPHFRSDEPQARPGGGQVATAAPRPLPADWQREADRVAAGLYVPPGVLINDAFDVLQFRGQTGPFLAPAPGEPSHNLLKMAREGLFMALRSAVTECLRTGGAVRHPDVRIRGEGVDREIDLHVLPVRLPQAGGERCCLVLFEETAHRITPGEAASERPAQDAEAPEMQHLRQELASTREYLQSMVEQQDAANEELTSANEEILSSNEELQSSNEELETAKEELQSINEELTTVNEQLQHRNAELAQLNDDMTNLLVSSGVPMVVLGTDLRIRRFNPAAGQLLGLLAGDLGRPLAHLRASVDLPDMEALVGEVIASVQPQERELRARDGRCHLLRVHPYRTADNRIDGAVLVLFDIDELRRAQSALEAERDYARAIVETVGEPLLVLDAQLRVQSANRAFYERFAVAPEATQGRPLYELGNGQWDIPGLRERLGAVLSGPLDFSDLEVRHDFESIGRKVMRLAARRIVREGAPSLILLAIDDRTELDRLEGGARDHVAQLVEQDRLKTAFLALLAHELRNPLAPIRHALHILDRVGAGDDTARRMRATIERQVGQMTRLVDDLLDVARINKGRIEVHKERLELGALLREAVDAAQPVCEARGIVLAAELPDAPLPIDADATRLSQVVGNVLNNAAKFTDPGGQIRLSLVRDAGAAVIRVADNGIGMAADQLPHVFDMFMQIDSSIGRSHSGLGLGLTLVKQLIEAHGGTVSASSDGIGRGSEFTLRLPLPDGAAAPAEAPNSAEAPASGTRPRRILIVDDNHDGAESLAMALGFYGHDVRMAHDGPAALALAATWRPEVILLDIGLPGMNGYEVARRLGGEPWRNETRLIALTGWGQAEDRRRTAEAGFDAHLVKPVDIEALMKLLAGPS
jgi:two-component system CheB/CheR fusion protein